MIARIMFVVMMILLVGGIVYDVTFYQSQVYPGNIAKDWLYRARATNDLRDMSLNLAKADIILQGYHGNPQWLFPTPQTDFDQIRGNVEVDISTANSLVTNSSLSQFAYQQAVANLQETINEVAGHLDSALFAIWNNPVINWLGLLVFFPTIFGFGGAWIYYGTIVED